MSEVESKHFNYPILITGGAGFLGSHMVALCLEKTSSNEHSNTNFLIFNGDLYEAMIAAGSNYQLHKSFAKNHQGVYIFKRKSID